MRCFSGNAAARTIWLYSLLALIFCATSGCVGSRSLALERAPETLAEVNAVLDGRPARIEFIDGRVVRRAKQVVEVTPEKISWQTYSSGVEEASVHHVERISLIPEMTVSGGAVLGGLAGTGALALGAKTCDGLGCISVYGLLIPAGVLAGAMVGKVVITAREARVIYRGPVERYLQRWE